MRNIAAIGKEYSLLPFKFLGIDIFSVNNTEEARKVLKKNMDEKYSIIFIDEFFIEEIKDFLNRMDLSASTTIIPLPLQGKSSGNAIKRTKDFIRKTIGVSGL